MNSVPIEYIGSKPKRPDTIAGTTTVWHGHGDVQPVPVAAAVLLLKHPDVWRLAAPKAPKTLASAPAPVAPTPTAPVVPPAAAPVDPAAATTPSDTGKTPEQGVLADQKPADTAAPAKPTKATKAAPAKKTAKTTKAK